jgi:hypothetical protein
LRGGYKDGPVLYIDGTVIFVSTTGGIFLWNSEILLTCDEGGGMKHDDLEDISGGH